MSQALSKTLVNLFSHMLTWFGIGYMVMSAKHINVAKPKKNICQNDDCNKILFLKFLKGTTILLDYSYERDETSFESKNYVNTKI